MSKNEVVFKQSLKFSSFYCINKICTLKNLKIFIKLTVTSQKFKNDFGIFNIECAFQIRIIMDKAIFLFLIFIFHPFFILSSVDFSPVHTHTPPPPTQANHFQFWVNFWTYEFGNCHCGGLIGFFKKAIKEALKSGFNWILIKYIDGIRCCLKTKQLVRQSFHHQHLTYHTTWLGNTIMTRKIH